MFTSRQCHCSDHMMKQIVVFGYTTKCAQPFNENPPRFDRKLTIDTIPLRTG